MAQGGFSSGMDEEESEDTEDFVPFPFMDPFVLGLKKEGDEKFQSKQYKEAAAIYTLAMNFPIFPFMDTSGIAEKLYRKRATCFFKMGKYVEAIEDCERAIELADIMGNKNLLAKSIFIKMKAIVCLGDYVPAFKLAVWCKHLRPNCEITKASTNDLKEKLREAFKKDASLIDEVLGTMVEFAEHLNFDDNTRELALESYTELLDLLDFMLLPGILRRQAEVLMNLGRCDEAKDICSKVLWLRRDDLKALELMTEIMQRLREGDKKQAKETKQTRTNAVQRESSEIERKADPASSKNCPPLLPKVEPQTSFSREEPDEIKTNDNAILTGWKEKVQTPATFPVDNSSEISPNDDLTLDLAEKKQRNQVTMENPEAVAIYVQQKMVDSDQTQGEYETAKENEKAERRRKKNRKKKEKKKEKKKAQQQNEGSPDPAPVNNGDEEPIDESPDEGDSQATDSVLGDPDVFLGYQSDYSTTMRDRQASFTTSGTLFSTLGFNQDEDSDGGDFIPVHNTRRPDLSTAKASTSTSDVQKQFEERASGLDWIDAPTGQQFQSVAEVKALPLTPEPRTSQLQGIPPSSGFRNEDNANTSEVRRCLSFAEFPNLAEGNINRPTPNSMHVGTSGNTWVNISPPDASLLNSSPFQSEVQLGKPTNEQLSRISFQGVHGQTSSSTGFACFPSSGQPGRFSNPVTFPQSFPKHSLNPPPGLNGPIKIPEGVCVVCEHFLQNIIKAKTCRFCEECGTLKYAAWNKNHSRWQVMRPYPRFKLPPRATFDVCKHFASSRQCLKEPCTFPHGEQEIIMWTLERQGLLASPEESLQLLRANTAAASMMIEPVVQVQKNSTNSMPLHTVENRGVSMASFGGSTLNGFPGLEAVPSQSATITDSTNTSASIWASPLETSGGSFEPVPPMQEPVVKTSQRGPLEAFASHSSTLDSSECTKSSAQSAVLNQSERTFTPVPPIAKPTITTSQVGRREAVSSPSSHADSSKDTTSLARSPILNKSERTFTTSHAGHTEAVSCKSSAEVSSESTTPPTWSSVVKQAATPASFESSGRPSTPILPSTTPANVPSQSSAVGSATITSYSAQSTSFERPSSPFPPSGKPATMTSSAGSPSKTASVPSSNSCNDFRKIPKGVYVVCDDFLQKNQRRPASIYEKTKACKGCENRSRLKYAVWSDNSKQWQLIRPYPAETVSAKVAFKECTQYASNIPCRKNPCSFPHGQLELIMWTMEREGVLPTPRETLTGSSGSVQSTLTMQPAVQLRYRPSPPGVTNGSYRICKSYRTGERCRFGRGCIFAHSPEELKEWEQEYDRKRREKLRKETEEKEEIGSLELASKILKGPANDRVEYLPGVEVTCAPPELTVRLKDKNETHKFQWTFSLIFKTHEVGYLEQVLLLHRYHNCYQLSDVRVRCYQDTPGCQRYKLCYTAKLNDPRYKSPSTNRPSGRVEVSLTVSFESHLYGSFEQLVLFDFGKKPYLVKKLNADVMSESLSQTSIVPKHATASASAVWDEVSMEVVRFVHGTSEAVQAEHLSRTYGLPRKVEIEAETLSPAVYKSLMHQLLFVEEGFMKDEISRYTLTKTQLHAQWNIFDEMTGMKCAVDGELFGVLKLQEEDALRPDDAAGRLLYRNVSSVWLQVADSVSNKVYEAPVEKVESECVVLRLSSKMCSDLKLYDTCDTDVNAQFQLNRTPLCEMHAAVDRLTKGQLRLIFPEPRTETVKSGIKIRWQWLLDERLNKNQKEVIERIALPEYNAPPLVVFGPFGTGKTFTLYQAVRLLVQVDKSHRILLCTHSNRAADIHVELLHDYLTKKNGITAARPLRVYQPMRRLETASEIARKYCLIKNDKFVLPSRDDLVEHRVVVTTLSTSKVLLDLQVLHGFFTHILIDEAAQALEPEALTPLIFAGPNTKVVFTGDHMQMSPEVYSPQARHLGLQKSLAERLFDVYDKHKAVTSNDNPQGDPNVLFLTENYRCHKEILQFPSDNFYGEKLVARGHALQPQHPTYGPLLFFSARGKEKKEHDNSYINLSEVYEVAKRVKEIADNWPVTVWGPKKLSDIAVLSSYRYQVQAIRNSLRKDPDLRDVKVDTIHNVQGEEFRVLIISTVRTFHTCKPQQQELLSSGTDRQLYWEFLSDPKLLNTAVTRARCLVAVIGDPVSLCTVGECRSIWRDYIKRCNKRGGLHGTTMQELEKEINASIASIELNPKAQPFVPTFPKTPEKGSTVSVTQEKVAQRDEGTEEGKRRVENVEEAQPLETHGRESSHQREINGNATENDCRDGKSGAFVDTTAKYQGERTTEDDSDDPDDEIDESGDFQDNLLEDETIFPRDMDEIILAFVRKCEETLQIDAQRESMFEESEFPTLQAAKDVNVKHQPANEAQRGSFKGGADIKDLFPEVRFVNGRVEVRLTNLGFYTSPSERATKIMISTRQQEFLDPSVLMKLLKEEPEKYIVCNLRLSPEKSQVGYADVEDTKTPSISIKGRVRQAFDKDKVVVELADKKARPKDEDRGPLSQGKVVGVLEHIIPPHERQFVCSTDYENPALMVPMNKSATKLVNLTDRSCKDIPIYKRDQNQRATQVRMMKREKVLSGKYLFVVKYLQWRRDFSYPLGIVVRTLSRGEDLKSSMEIAYAEHGIRRVFKEETKKYVKENFPPEWSIPETERKNRTKVVGAFTIDPPKSLDLDDALTIERDASSSTFVVGIHIADVSFFVKPNSPLDHEAFLRCTSYYPGDEHENVPMLPRELSEKVCSLLPNEDRLAVSVFVNLNEEGNLSAEPSIKRTIIRSCCRLSYAEAQMAIRCSSVSSIADVPVEVLEKIRQLSSLAQKRRRLRLGDCAFDHWQNVGVNEDFEAHELVEEMMILANEEIAEYLSQKSSELAPLRIQLPPKEHRLAEWIEIHGKYARLSLKLSEIFNNETTEASTLNVLHDEKIKFKIQRSVWSAMCHAVDSSDLPRLQQLICNENNHPQVAVALSNFRRIQSESRYVCEGDQPPDNIFHYSLRTRCYTHFTSPIRRYIDIVVHRLLLGWQAGSSYAESPSKDDIAKACRRSTFMSDNARKFDKDCKRIHMANQLQQRCRETRVFIESIEHQSISLHISNHEDDHLAGNQKRVLLSHLNLVDLKEEEEKKGKEKTLVLKWKFRKYIAPNARNETEKVTKPGYSGGDEVVEIPSDIWLRVLDAIRTNDADKLAAIVKQTETKLGILCGSRRRDEPPQPLSPHNVRGVPYKHPHHNEKATPPSEETADHFYEKSIALRKYEFFSVQLCPHMTRGILQPDIQIFKVDPHINICIEHHRYPRESFAHTARHQASRERYGTIDEYIRAWKPVLAMEAATEAVKENDGFIIEDLKVKWKHEPEDVNITGLFTLPWSYCDSRQLTFFSGDLACIRVPYCDRDTGSGDETSNERKPSTDGQRSGDNRPANDFWVVHCILKKVTNKREIKTVEVQLEFHQTSSKIPDWLTHGNGHRSTLELIHRTLPQRRMYAALCINLIDSSELAHAICKGDEPSKENFGDDLPLNLSLMQHGFQKLNRYQETAVREALSKPFTLIQGPPGTGKTVTGVHIANWFAEQNKRLKSYKVLEKETGQTECAGAYKAPPQVIYCGPSNKSVDVVAEYLLKIPNLKILRVYSDQIEQKEFPVPNKLKPPRATRSADELKISSEKIRCVSLHHVIRGPECPFSEDLRQYEEGFEQSKAKKESIGQKEVSEYCKLIGQAETWVLKESGVQIILCTCATSGSPRLASSCDNIQQCIVDECGMCMEPESLVPITSSGARQVVLIGDHKQLQPVIQDHVAKTLGLSVSMFERHSHRAKMLELQYRMHIGICEFPSKQFYDEKLQTADSVKSRDPSPVTFWPALVRRQRNLPIVFCHVEGQEESSVISTSESNEESKRNMKEVRKAVQIAKYLVNRHRQRVRMSDVVILSPYREQRSKITELLKGAYDDIQVTTVIKSQGSEWDYVIMSLVRSLKRDEIDPEPSLSWLREHLGFLTDEHQMNVGLTRARRGLCIIGNKYLLGMDPMWKSLIQHYEDNHCLVDESWPWS